MPTYNCTLARIDGLRRGIDFAVIRAIFISDDHCAGPLSIRIWDKNMYSECLNLHFIKVVISALICLLSAYVMSVVL